jgi:hypothetical protein
MAGCAMPQYGIYTREVDAVGGETVRVEFNRAGPVMAENDDVRIIIASIVPFDGHLIQLFRFAEKRGKLPRSVKVEDVTAEAPEVFVDEKNPKFFINPKKSDIKNIWEWRSAPLDKIGWKAIWLYDPDETLRIYRFTIVTSDGRKLVMNQVTPYPAFVKTRLLKELPDAPKKDDAIEELHL